MATQVNSPVMLDFSDIFHNKSSSQKGSSPMKQRLENWEPNRPEGTSVADSLKAATKKRAAVLENKKAKATSISKADEIKKAKALEAEKLAALISSKVEAALVSLH
jgi:hypothetical protein